MSEREEADAREENKLSFGLVIIKITQESQMRSRVGI